MKKKALGRGIDALIPGSVDLPIHVGKRRRDGYAQSR